MVLVVGEQLVKEVPSSTSSVYSTWPRLKDTSHSLTSLPSETVGPRGLLYIRPREYAVTVPQDDAVQFLGTDDATTSVMAVLRHTGSGAIALAHFDKCSHEECLGGGHICSHDDGVLAVLTRVTDLSMGYTEGRLELCVVGGFHDARTVGEKVALSLLNAFHKSVAQIHLVLLCTGDCNTIPRGNISWPIVKGIAVSTQTGKIFPATFTDKGPYLVIRSTRVFTGAQQMVDVYDCAPPGMLRIGPFNYEPHVGVELLLQQTDEVILQCLSTSPEVESPTWVKLVRDVLKHIKDHPFPAVTIFPDNRPHYFRRDRHGSWSPVELPNNNDSTTDANLVNSAAIMATAVAAIAPHTPAPAIVAGGNATLSVPNAPTTPASTAWTPPISSSQVPPAGAQVPPLQAHPPLQSGPNGNAGPQAAVTAWGAATPTHGVPPRYGSLHLDCRLKTHIAGPVAPAPHYEDQLLNTKPDRFLPAWQTSQL